MTKGIPVWVLIWALILAVVGIGLGLMELIFDPGFFLDIDNVNDESQAVISRGWGGRNLALGVTAAIAVLLRDRAGMAVALAGAIAREVSDIVTAALEGQDVASYLFAGIMLAIDVVAFGAVIGSAWSNRNATKGTATTLAAAGGGAVGSTASSTRGIGRSPKRKAEKASNDLGAAAGGMADSAKNILGDDQ